MKKHSAADEEETAAPARKPPGIEPFGAASTLCALVGMVLSFTDMPRVALALSFGLCVALALLSLWAAKARAETSEREIDRRANERHLASLGSMIAVISHEIRNPLAALKGNAQLLLETKPDDPKHRTRIERVVREAIALERLTNDLLTFVRSGRLRRDPTDVRVLVQQAVTTVGSSDVAVHAPEEAVIAPIDRVRFLQAVDNLVRNAMLHGKPPIDVNVTAERDAVVIVVRDHGKGIPDDKLERIFEPFETDATRGTGLGLAVVRRVAELHGGTAKASNAKDGGARFELRFPTEVA